MGKEFLCKDRLYSLKINTYIHSKIYHEKVGYIFNKTFQQLKSFLFSVTTKLKTC